MRLASFFCDFRQKEGRENKYKKMKKQWNCAITKRNVSRFKRK